jgi:hypothetical protein
VVIQSRQAHHSTGIGGGGMSAELRPRINHSFGGQNTSLTVGLSSKSQRKTEIPSTNGGPELGLDPLPVVVEPSLNGGELGALANITDFRRPGVTHEIVGIWFWSR